MKAAIIGLGKMGSNMARRLIRNGHQIIGYNLSPDITREGYQEFTSTPGSLGDGSRWGSDRDDHKKLDLSPC